MNSIKEINTPIISQKIYKNASILKTNEASFVFKKHNNSPVYKYLLSRSFDNIPTFYTDDNALYDLTEYIEGIEYPEEQKALDIMYLLSILHTKTLYYKDLTLNTIKEQYENLIKEIDDTYNYYYELNNQIDNTFFHSPSSYLLVRNISLIYYSLTICKELLNTWYDDITKESKERIVQTHNNIDLTHIIKKDKEYLISWDHSIKSSPINDIVKFYRTSYQKIDFVTLLQYYEKRFPLTKEERIILLVKLLIPKKIILSKSYYQDTLIISNFFLFLNKAIRLKNHFYNQEKQQSHLNKQ